MIKNIVFVLTGIMLSSGVVFAKAYFSPKDEMLERASVIAVVDIIKVEDFSEKGKTWTYKQKITAKVEQVIKGDLGKEIHIYGGETFICAQCHYESGKTLVFLRRDGDFWVCSNWHFSNRPIKDDMVEWYKIGSDNIYELEYQPLNDVLKEIRSNLARREAESNY